MRTAVVEVVNLLLTILELRRKGSETTTIYASHCNPMVDS
jgi:hypothetical protein